MSEYQYVGFRAVDRPLTDKQLDYAHKQSSRAEISRWSFENEYHYSGFRGSVEGLLRNGYDVHLHYANFGVHRIVMRLPEGLPFAKKVWSHYVGIGEFCFKKDAKGSGGILELSPFHESGDLEPIYDPGDYLDDVVEMRNRLIGGDLRVLYALWLCAALDDQSVEPDVIEPPVPGGMEECVEAFGPVMAFFGLDPLILLAASEGAPAAPTKESVEDQHDAWVKGLSAADAKQWLRRCLCEDAIATQRQIRAVVRDALEPADSETVALGRTFQQLLDRTEVLRSEHDARKKKKRQAAAKRQAKKQEQQRKERMKEMVKNPKKWLREADRLVDACGTSNYKAAADILADLREAVGGDNGDNLTRHHAAHLAKRHPTLNHLKSSLRKRDLLK